MLKIAYIHPMSFDSGFKENEPKTEPDGEHEDSTSGSSPGCHITVKMVQVIRARRLYLELAEQQILGCQHIRSHPSPSRYYHYLI